MRIKARQPVFALSSLPSPSTTTIIPSDKNQSPHHKSKTSTEKHKIKDRAGKSWRRKNRISSDSEPSDPAQSTSDTPPANALYSSSSDHVVHVRPISTVTATSTSQKRLAPGLPDKPASKRTKKTKEREQTEEEKKQAEKCVANQHVTWKIRYWLFLP